MKNDFLKTLLNGQKVEWRQLGEVCEVKAGETINKNFINQNAGSYAVINSGREPLGFVNKYNTENDPIGITSRGAGVGSITWQKGRYFRGNLNYSCTIKDSNQLLKRYLYHLLNCMQKEIQSLCTYQGIPALNSSNLINLTIPIPPISVQGEIVRILDKFTEFTAELKAQLTTELTARKKQYEYYRNKLLTFKEGEAEWRQLGDIGSIKMCKRILKQQTSSSGEIPFYKIGTFGKEADSFISKQLYLEYCNKYSFPKLGDILISASGTIGRAVAYDGKPAYFQDSNIVWIDNDEKMVLNKYLWHFYKIAKWNVSSGGTIDRLYNNDLRKIQIPIPPLSKQKEIVAILDKFDALTNSITEGLPKEIELRQKQYEYYRDLLLNFSQYENK
jgi:type I restriction enzyme S subunit